MIPTPNKYGVYSHDDAEQIEFHTSTAKGWCGPKASCEVFVIEIKPDQWAASASYNFNLGDFSGCHSPLMGDRKGNNFANRDIAVRSKLTYLADVFSRKIRNGPVGCATETQLEECKKLLHQIQQYTGLPTDDGQTDMFSL
jgi:hypothetical protein